MKKDTKNELDKYKEFEENIDIVVDKFDYLRFYLNDVLDFFHLNIASKYSGERLSTDEYKIEPSSSFSSTLSYLLPLLNNCKKDFNRDYFENTFIKKMIDFTPTLIKYGLFSEVAPFIWRKVYIPNINAKTLRMYYDTDYYEFEVKDAILTAIATGISATNDLEDCVFYDLHVQDIINSRGVIPSNNIIIETIKSKKWYKEYRFDDLIVSQNVYLELGISKDEYVEFQSFWLGITTYYIKTYEALIRYARTRAKVDDDLVQILISHFASPNILKISFYTKFDKLIGLSEDKFYRLMSIFSLNIYDEFKLQDGHYPVFIEYEDLYLFSPFNVRGQLSPRNLLYLLNKNETKNFNDNISKHLEPELINYCINLLKKIPHLEIQSNIKWGGSNGEFDIIAYDTLRNNILHFQAKASIPVEGARMTQNLESRIKEGISQIERFNEQSSIKKDDIVSEIFRKNIKNPGYIDIIVGWGGFGTYNTWKSLNEKTITALNIAVLNQYIKKYEDNYELSNFYNDINELINEIINSSSPKKITNKLKIGNYKISYESFNYQKTKLFKYRYIPY